MESKLKNLFKPLKIGNTQILPIHSIYENYVPESNEVTLNNGQNIWIYKNENINLPKRVSKKQVRLISRFITLFNDIQNQTNNNIKYISSKNYIPYNILSIFTNFMKTENTINPTTMTEQFLLFSTVDFANTFSLSYFTMYYKNITNTKDDNLKNLILNFFKFLSRNNIVVISKNIFGDYIINPVIPTTKTSRNSGIFNELNYMIPVNKINIIDLSVIYLISSSFKIENNLVFGKISKIKKKSIQKRIPLIEIDKLLRKISVSMEGF